LNTMPIRVFWKDMDLVYLGCNQVFARDAGFNTPQEIVGKDDYQMGWSPQAELYRADDRLVIQSGVPKLLNEEPQTTPDGQTITLLTSKVPLRDASGKVCGVLGTYMDITVHKQAEKAVKESLERQRQFVQPLDTVREEDRKRISRELHDDIGQILTALKIDLVLVDSECSCHEGVRSNMRDMQKLLSEGIQSVHSLCRRLRPGALDDLSLQDALEGLIDDWKKRNRIECEMHADVTDGNLSEAIKTTVFRVVQEALTNVSRYAHASKVDIHLVDDEESLTVSFFDNGCGMDMGLAEKPTSFGLMGMRERIESLGGTLHIESAPGQGTRIEAIIPLAFIPPPRG
ncbi:MAG: PAS domain-containing protein, partial [Verrucomicrobia bacterium]|nr:PAS domain-containing protein [Verrucomicrobiota bacterium]